MTTTITGATGVDNIRAATGAVLQVVSTVKTSVFSTGSTSWIDITGMAATITPSSTSSKIFIQVDVTVGTGSNSYSFGRLMRGSTAIGIGDASSNRNRVTFSLSGNSTHVTKSDNRGCNFLDSPSTTSATTYKVQVKTSQTVKINTTGEDENHATTGLRAVSTITLMEIAG